MHVMLCVLYICTHVECMCVAHLCGVLVWYACMCAHTCVYAVYMALSVLHSRVDGAQDQRIPGQALVMSLATSWGEGPSAGPSSVPGPGLCM